MFQYIVYCYIPRQIKSLIYSFNSREWDKFDIEAELAKADDVEPKPQVKKANMAGVTLDLDTQGLSEAQRKVKAEREKDKGNEAFR